MEVSLNGLIEIAGHEGVVLSPYLDSVGVWTIFIGHTNLAGPPNPLSFPKGVEQPVAEAIRVFRIDMQKFEARVNEAVKVPVSQSEFDALVSFDFNTGGIYKANLTKLLNSGAPRNKVADAFMGWSKPPEIIGRRTKEMELFRTGKYGPGMVAIFKANEAGRVNYGTGRQVNLRELLTTSSSQTPPAQSGNQSQIPQESIPESRSCFSLFKSLLKQR